MRKQLELEERIEQLIEDIETAKKELARAFEEIFDDNTNNPYPQTSSIIRSKCKKELESSLKELQSLYSKYRKFLTPSLRERVEQYLK